MRYYLENVSVIDQTIKINWIPISKVLIINDFRQRTLFG